MQKLSDKILRNLRGVILAAMVALIALSFGVTVLVLRPKVDHLFQTIACAKAEAVDYFLKKRLGELALLRASYQANRPMEENLADFRLYGDMLGVYASLGVVDETGVVHTTEGNSFSIRERAYYRQACEDNAAYVLSPSIYSLEDNEPVVIVLMPLEDGRFFSAALGVQYAVEVIRSNQILASSLRIVDQAGKTEMETAPFPRFARIYQAEVPAHPGWRLEIGVSPLYTDAVFYLLGGFLLAVFALMHRGLDRALTRRVEAELRPLEAMAQDMTSADLTDPQPLHLQADSAETGAILEGYETLRRRIVALLEAVKTEQKSRMESDHQALLEQIKPHFLYNTLETIQVMTLDGDPDQVGDALQLLGRYFRLSLADGQRTVTLAQEVMLVRTYVQLQKLRYGDRLALQLRSDLPMDEYVLPKFLLQPLVENALYHGLKPLPGGGTILLEAWESEGWLTLRVGNPCPAPDLERLEELACCLAEGRKPTGSNGLHNVAQRLRLRYGRQCLFLRYADGQVTAEIRLKREECHEDPDRR